MSPDPGESGRERTAAESERLVAGLREIERELQAELDVRERLLKIGSLSLEGGSLKPVLDEVVAAAIAFSGADFGNIQLRDPRSGDLQIAAQAGGFPDFWLEFWDRLCHGQGACGTALERGQRIVVEDVETSPIFVGTPALDIQLRAGIRAVQSTPLVGLRGTPVGMLSTHWRRPGRPSERALALLDRLARQAADVIEWAQAKRALEETNALLRAADRRKDDFLGVLSHELRNPLAPIHNSFLILGRAAPGGEEARRAQEVIERQVGYMTRLVGDLLDVTRIASGKLAIEREPLDLGELARRTVDDYRGTFEESGGAIEMRPPAAEVWVRGDRTRLAQVIGNLLHNAGKFTPRGGRTTVSVERDEAREEAVLRVEDTGRGIAPDILHRVFEPYVQADATLDRSLGGLGLGLALVKGIVETQGGSVRCESGGIGKGASFTITLPLAAAVAKEPDAPRGGAGATARRVLLIEDDADVAASFRTVLELCGQEVEVARSSSDGIRRARAWAPDVVLCDIGLPEMDGYAVARALRAEPALARVRLVALTGYARAEDVEKAKAAGFDAHLPKPPKIEALERVVAEDAGPHR
jgi:signal transduction histidine kinase/CheY-like chemotaxis protein